MRKWRDTVRVSHLLTEGEDYESVRAAMIGVADELEKHQCFAGFDALPNFRRIPNPYEGAALALANDLLDRMYDYADSNDIWID